MQGVFSMVVNASALHVMMNSAPGQKIGTWEIAGAIVWAIGFLWEVIGDAQLQAHKDDPAQKGQLMKSGLWKYSRHPNYFGESLLWWGVYLIACGQKDGYWTFYSALFITLLLRYVSGVAMLERKQKKKAEFRVYMMETAAFIPWFQRPVEASLKEGLLKKFEEQIEAEAKKRKE